jgi:hypothetical protein
MRGLAITPTAWLRYSNFTEFCEPLVNMSIYVNISQICIFYYYVTCSFVSLSILTVMYVPFCVFCLFVFCVLFVCKYVLYYCHRDIGAFSTTLTEVFSCFFLSCKANTRVYLAKTGHGPHFTFFFYCYVYYVVCILCTVCV